MALDVDALKARADLVAIVGSYVSLKKRGQEFLGLCPFHDDHNASMYVVPAKGLVHCFSCGWSGDVLDFLQEKEGIDFKEAVARISNGHDWTPKPITQSAQPAPERVTSKPPAGEPPPDMAIRALGAPVTTWEYKDLDGEVLGYVARYESEGKKEIRCWTWGARGQARPAWGCGHWSKPRPLYGLDRAAALPEHPALIVEGEKAADAAQALLPGYVVLTWPGGAQAWKHANWEPLRGRRVDLWPDNDSPGREAMQGIAGIISDPRGLACHGKLIDPRDVPEAFDAADWTEDRGDLMEWLRARATTYPAPQEGEAARPAKDSSSSTIPAAAGPDAPGSRLSDAEPPSHPDLDPPPIGAPTPPAGKRRRKKPDLSLVEGNTARSPNPEDDPEPLPAELSEDAMSDDFAAQHGEDWRCVKAWGQWLHWDGEAWCEDRDDSRVEPMRQLYRRALYTPEGQRLTPDGRRKLGRQAVAYASLRYAGTDPRIRSMPEVWDSDPYMLGVPGGVVDLREGKLIESAREQHITMRCAVAPERGEPTTWLSMLRYWMGDDADVIAFLRRYLGYAMTGDGREQCMAFFYGPAASGKGTIMRLISYILGSVPPPMNTKFRSYHYEAPIATFLEARSDRHSTELAAMHQKRLITSEEPAAGARWDEAKIKWLTGGSLVTARFMRGDNFSFSMTGKLIVAANHRPRLATTDASIKRRLHVIQFEHPVPDEERDNSLDAKLRAEAPQILHWLIEACLEWQQCGLGLPDKIAANTENYLQAEDVLAQWIDEACDREIDSDSATLYRSYCRWAEEQGEKVWSRRAWANALVERGFKTRRGTAGVRMFCDLSPKLGAGL